MILGVEGEIRMFKLLSEVLSHLYSVYIGLDVRVMNASRHA
jgi:hypothetical protein